MQYCMGQVVQLYELYQRMIKKKLPIRVSYKFARLGTRLRAEVEFYQNKMTSILDEYGKKDENGNYLKTPDQSGIQIQDSKFEECIQAVKELQSIEIKIDEVQFEIEELEGLDLTGEEVELLLPLIK